MLFVMKCIHLPCKWTLGLSLASENPHLTFYRAQTYSSRSPVRPCPWSPPVSCPRHTAASFSLLHSSLVASPIWNAHKLLVSPAARIHTFTLLRVSRHSTKQLINLCFLHSLAAIMHPQKVRASMKITRHLSIRLLMFPHTVSKESIPLLPD